MVGNDDRLHRQDSVVGQQFAHVFEERVVLPPVDRFDHLDRHDLVERAPQVAVIGIEHRDPIVEAGARAHVRVRSSNWRFEIVVVVTRQP